MNEKTLKATRHIEDHILKGGGEMGALMRSIDWSSTPVGPVETWPQALKSTVNMLLNSKFGMFLWWGPELVQFYNDSYRPSFGTEGEKHPQAMGQRGAACWAEIWDIIHPQIEQVLQKGIPTWNENQLVPIYRNGILEEVYWTYSYSPVYDDDGKIAGVLVVESETTSQVINYRRSNLLRELTDFMVNMDEVDQVFRLLRKLVGRIPEDIPFSMMYVVNEADDTAELAFSTGFSDDDLAGIASKTVGRNSRNDPWHIWEVLESGTPLHLEIPISDKLPRGVWPEPVKKAYAIPVTLRKAETPIGLFICGISPRLNLDADYKHFLQSLGSQIATGLNYASVRKKQATYQHKLEVARKEAESASKRLYDMFMNAPAIIATFSGPDLIFEFANPLYRQLVNVNRKLDGESLFDAIPELDPGLVEIIKNVVTNGERFVAKELPVSLDWNYDGKIFTKYIELLYEPLFSDGMPDGMMVFAYDVTDHVLSRRRLEEQNQVLKILTEGVSATEALEFLALSMEKQTTVKSKCSILLLDDDRIHLRHGAAPNLPEAYIRAIDGVEIGGSTGSCGTAAFTGKPVIVEDISTDPLWKDYKDLAEQHGLRACWSTPIFSSSKEVIGTFAIYYEQPHLPTEQEKDMVDFATRTVSLFLERKASEDALRHFTERLEQQKRMYDSITASTPDLIYVISTDFRFTYVNDALLAVWGKTMDESVGKTFFELGYEEWHAEMHERELSEVIKTKKPYRGEVSFPHASLGERIYDYIFAPIFDSSGEVAAIAGTTRDITELKRLEKQKDQFIAIASHELKTPLTSLKAYTQLLQSRFEKQADLMSSEFMKKMDLQINKLTNLINDLLDITKMQGGKLLYNLQHFQLNPLIRETTEEIQRTTSSHSLNVYPGDDVSVYGDPDRIGQVLMNYLTNAIKYSPQAELVNVRTTFEDGYVIVSVEDFGFGIAEDKLGKVFEQFYRVEGGMLETFAGLGIGLYICKEIITRHHGEVWAESEPQKGSVFYFKIPVEKH